MGIIGVITEFRDEASEEIKIGRLAFEASEVTLR